MRQKQQLFKFALLQEQHETLRALIHIETDKEQLRVYKAKLEDIAAKVRDLHREVTREFPTGRTA